MLNTLEEENSTMQDNSAVKAAWITGIPGIISGIIITLLGAWATGSFHPPENTELNKLRADLEQVQTQLEDTQGRLNHYKIPENTNIWNGHRYWVSSGIPDWQKAEDCCEYMGGHLVTITSAEEYAHVSEYVRENVGVSTYVWLGLKQTNGLWNQWVTGEHFDIGEVAEVHTITNAGYFTMSNYKDGEVSVVVGESSWPINRGDIVWAPSPSDGNSEGWFVCEWDWE